MPRLPAPARTDLPIQEPGGAWLLAAADGGEQQTGNGLTTYWFPAARLGDATATESTFQTIVRDSYTLSGLRVRVTGNTLTGATTIRLRKNGANGNQSVSIGAGATGVFQDTTNSDSLVAGDLFNNQVVAGAGPALGLTLIITSYTLRTPGGTVPFIATQVGGTMSATLTVYIFIGGLVKPESTTESPLQYRVRTSATLSNFWVRVGTNTANGVSTIRTRKNGANGNQSVSVPASTSGTFEDTANTDSVADGDLLNYQEVIGGSAGGQEILIIHLRSRSAVRPLVMGASSAWNPPSAFSAMEGYRTTPGADTWVQLPAPEAFTARKGFLSVSSNSRNGASTLRLRKNGANGNIVISIPASTTGAFEDTANTDSFVADDLINWQWTIGGTLGTLSCLTAAVEQAPAATARSNSPTRTSAASRLSADP